MKLNEKVHERAGRGGPTRPWNTLVPSLRLTEKNWKLLGKIMEVQGLDFIGTLQDLIENC